MIPIADAFGGWIHWEEFPPPVIHSVELVRGGASNLYGSSAIGGVISIIEVRPEANHFQLSTSYGSEATSDNSLLGVLKLGKWSGLANPQVPPRRVHLGRPSHAAPSISRATFMRKTD